MVGRTRRALTHGYDSIDHLGQTGLELSPIGLGTVKIGRNTDLKYPSGFELPSDHEIIELLRLASQLGINCLDTAPAYGTSEKRLGAVLPEVPNDFHIITKVAKTTIRTPEVITISLKKLS